MKFIAEIGLNHNGNFNLCYELIRKAKESGADIAKFQCGWRQEKSEINHMDAPRIELLSNWCEYFDIEFLCSVFTLESYELVKAFGFKSFKIASRTVKDDPELVKRVIEESEHVIISLGMWDLNDGLPFKGDNIQYLWCKSLYPAQPWELTDFPKDFNDTPFRGYSDHTVGIETALMAVTRGAKIIEKHFTLDKSDITIRDHTLSALPEEFLQLTTLGKDIFRKLELGV